MQHLQLSLMSVCNHRGFLKPEGVIIPGHDCTVHTLIVDKEAQFGGRARGSSNETNAK